MQLVCYIICMPVRFACTEADFVVSEIADFAQTENCPSFNWTNCIFPRRISISKCLLLGVVNTKMVDNTKVLDSSNVVDNTKVVEVTKVID